MKIKDICKKGLEIILAIYLAGCAKGNFKEIPNFNLPSKDEILALYVKKNGGYAIRLPEEGECIWNNMDVERLKNNNIDILAIWEEQYCILPPKNLKPNENYVLKRRDYYIVNNGIVNGEINQKGDICFDDHPYIGILLLDNNVLIYFVDTDRNGLFDYNVSIEYNDKNRFMKVLPEKLPEPVKVGCYTETLI